MVIWIVVFIVVKICFFDVYFIKLGIFVYDFLILKKLLLIFFISCKDFFLLYEIKELNNIIRICNKYWKRVDCY